MIFEESENLVIWVRGLVEVKMGYKEGRKQHMQEHDLIPLASLISKEMKNEKMGKPTVKYGHAAQSKKGEDFFLVKTDCQRVPGNSASTFSVFAVCTIPCHLSCCCVISNLQICCLLGDILEN